MPAGSINKEDFPAPLGVDKERDLALACVNFAYKSYNLDKLPSTGKRECCSNRIWSQNSCVTLVEMCTEVPKQRNESTHCCAAQTVRSEFRVSSSTSEHSGKRCANDCRTMHCNTRNAGTQSTRCEFDVCKCGLGSTAAASFLPAESAGRQGNQSVRNHGPTLQERVDPVQEPTVVEPEQEAEPPQPEPEPVPEPAPFVPKPFDPLITDTIFSVFGLLKACSYDAAELFDSTCEDVEDDDTALAQTLTKVFGKKDPRTELNSMKESKRASTLQKCEKVFREMRAKIDKEKAKKRKR